MYEFSSIFIYFLSIIIVISAMTLVVLLTAMRELSRRRQFMTLIAFCACNLLLQLLYIGMTVQDVLLKYYHYSVYLRIADIALYTFQSYLWCRYLLFFPLRPGSAAARFGRSLCNITAAVSLAIGVYNYAFNIDDEFLYLHIPAFLIELLCTALISMMLIISVSGLKRGAHRRFDLYNIAITLLLIFIQLSTDISMIAETIVGFSFSAHEYLAGSLQQMLLTLTLVFYVYRADYSGVSLRQQLRDLTAAAASAGNAEVLSGPAVNPVPEFPAASAEIFPDNAAAAESADTAGPAAATSASQPSLDTSSGSTKELSAPAAVAMQPSMDGIGSLPHTLNSDPPEESVHPEETPEEPGHPKPSVLPEEPDYPEPSAADTANELSLVDRLFDSKQLTPREREVARLAYSGLTNPEIADRLCISQYTVKRHMHSIFEKLGISARIELVHLMSGH